LTGASRQDSLYSELRASGGVNQVAGEIAVALLLLWMVWFTAKPLALGSVAYVVRRPRSDVSVINARGAEN
jgi:hypothetical protein